MKDSKVYSIDGFLDVIAPIAHFGDEKTGSTPVLRALNIWNPDENRHVRLPFFSGNAVRGVLRRMTFRDMCDRLDYTIESSKLHHALFTGGILESTKDAGRVDLDFRRWVRDTFPPIGIFGTVLGNQMIPSCMKCDHAMPICLEYKFYLPEVNDPRTQHSIRTFTDISFATRRDDLRADREEDEQAQQMKIEFESFVPGTRFVHGFHLSYPSFLESSCLSYVLELWSETPYIGGKSSSGYGKIKASYPVGPVGAKPYAEYLDQNKQMLRDGLDRVAEVLENKTTREKKAPVGGKDVVIDSES